DVGRGGGRGARQARAQCAALGLQTPQARAEEARAEADQTHRYSSCFNRPTPHARQGQGDTLKGLVPTPILLWHGSHSEPIPACPSNAMATGSLLGRDPIPPNTCPLCECGDPACVLPQGLIADGTAGCGMAGPFTPFPAEPDGSCSNK